MKYIFILFFTCTSVLLHAQEKDFFRQNPEELIAAIAKDNRLMGNAVGFGGMKPKQYYRFEALKEKATLNELVTYSTHENAVVRAYTMQALLERKERIIFDVLAKQLFDTTTVSTMFGCIMSAQKVNDYYVQLLRDDYFLNGSAFYYPIMRSSWKENFDHIILFGNHPQKAKLAVLLPLLSPQTAYYANIRNLVMEGNYYALPILARYQKAIDRDLILSLKDKRDSVYSRWPSEVFLLNAIEEFPDPYFIDYLQTLEKRLADEESHYSIPLSFYRACAAYTDERVLTILQNKIDEYAEKSPEPYELNVMNLALSQHINSKNVDLAIQLWKKFQYVTLKSFQFIKKHDLETAKEIVPIYLTGLEGWRDFYSMKTLHLAMFNLIRDEDEKQSIDLLAKCLASPNRDSFDVAIPLAIAYPHSRYYPILFSKISSSKDSYGEILGAMYLLWRYELPDIRNRILKSLQQNPHFDHPHETKEEVIASLMKRFDDFTKE